MQAVVDLATGSGIAYDQYDRTALSDTTIDSSKNLRQWTYQYCNEFGFLQTPNTEQPVRSEYLDLAFWKDYCDSIFGTEMKADADRTNKHYGGLDIHGDNIVFMNGSEDPW